MIQSGKRGRAVALVWAAICLPWTAWAQPAPIPDKAPASSYFQERTFSAAQLSPDGKKVAFKLRVKDGPAKLVVMDLASQTPTVVASFERDSVGNFAWVNDNRLVLNLASWLKSVGQRDINPGLFAVDANGERFKQLAETIGSFVKSNVNADLLPQWTEYLRSSADQTGDDIWVTVTEAYDKKAGADYRRVRKVNTVTGRWTEIEAPLHAHHWVFDTHDRLRAALESRDGQQKMLYRAPDQTWQTLATVDSLTTTLYPIHIDNKDQLYVVSNQGKDTTGLYTWDFAKQQLSAQPLLSSSSFDIQPQPVVHQGQIQGWRFTIDAAVTQWTNDNFKSLQDSLDKALPSTINTISVGTRSETPHVLINTHSDRTPGSTLLFNRETRKFSRLGDAMPQLRGQAMAGMAFVRYPARDGLSIPAYLSLPPGDTKKSLPLLVLVHGGPWLRGQSWGWNPEVQFLASRGYAVLQPEFRGSTGFGRKLFEASWRQWGQAMQHDLADAARWAIAQGIADPQRICIMGGSYGGYATMMGLVNDPDLFRCGINWVGVTDQQLMYSVSWSDITDQVKTYGLPRLMGDSAKDADMFKAYSPLQQAFRIKTPVLMAYGGKDERVPLIHGEKMRDALKSHNPQVEWIEYKDEGHGFVDLHNRVDFWERVEKFLARHLSARP
jgi:dipeptidyl aminopeptidase/acylaminoacyl peptidase